jgi:CysZ protein
MPVENAREFRRMNSPQVFISGFIPALLAIVPIVNLVVPLFATAYFMHILKAMRRRSSA